MKICLILEGCYPYVHGGVSTWMHQYITIMKEHEFVLWVIGAKAEQKGKFVYDLPDNVTEIHEVFLDDALKSGKRCTVCTFFAGRGMCAGRSDGLQKP